MLVAAAVCPHPPLLIPAATGRPGQEAAPGADADASAAAAADAGAGPAAEIARLRAACREAVAGLAAVRPDVLVVAGGGPRTVRYSRDACGSLSRLGIPARTGAGDPVLPLSLTIGAWLVRGLPDGAGPGQVVFQEVGRDRPARDCLRLGAELAALAPRVALLAMGDGTARRAAGEPGAPDPAAQAYDARVAAALAAADTDALAALDPAADAALMIAGRAAWQVLAGAAGCGPRLRGRLSLAGAPFGVGYLVACWDLPAR